MSIALIIPVYNGEQYLDDTFRELEVFFGMGEGNHVVFVDDGSTDGTADRLRETYGQPRVSVVTLPRNEGKGRAVRAGILSLDPARFDIIGFTDVELPYGVAAIRDIPQTDADMIYGERAQVASSYTPYRRLMKSLFRLLLPQTVRYIRDTQCGFKFFRSSVVRDLFEPLTSGRWVFDVELFLRARTLGLRLQPISLTIKPHCVSGGGGVSLWRHSKSILREISHLRRIL